jgi:alanyl-tRNA synthetase
VNNEVLPLDQASKIKGLRAVFGEVYPDPVRVLSIGPSITDLNQNPNDERWMDFSVEFCGGTHIRQTKDAEAFAILGNQDLL